MPRLDGVDISHHQDDAGPIDWPTLRNTVWWIATKATQGTAYVDPTFKAHWSEMYVQFTHRLAYHWLTPDASPFAQAQHFLQTVQALSAGGGAMLDAEQPGITAAMVLEWCETVEAVTQRPCSVYTGAYVAGGTIWQSTRIRTSKYGPRPMHLAAYTSEQVALGLPGVKAYPWSAWQFSSNGPVPGVTGRCDMNRIDNRTAYDLVCAVKPQPPQGDDDMKGVLLTVTGLPGLRLWAFGSDPIELASIADAQALCAGLGINPDTDTKTISQEQYGRLFAKPQPVTVNVPPVVFPTKFSGTVS